MTVPDRSGYLRAWSSLHGGHDPRGLTGRWLAAVYRLAVPLARRRVRPSAVTAGGVLVALAVPALATRPLLAVPAVVVSGVLDSLDGAVAVLAGRASRMGAVLDSLADRVADTAYVVGLWVVGAPGWLCALAAGLTGGQEYARARAGVAGMAEIGVVTVFERPTRVLLAAFLLLGAALLPHDGTLATGGAAVWCVLAAAGCAQFLVAARRALAAG